MSDNKTKMDRLIDQLEARDKLSDQDAIRTFVSDLPRTVLLELATRWTLYCINKRLRSQALKVERTANVSTTMHEGVSLRPGWDSLPPNRMNETEKRAYLQTDAGKMWDAEQQAYEERMQRESEAEHERINRRFMSKINEALETYKAQLRIEWTEELLESTFNLHDGTVVTWGNATLEQHEERVEMFRNNAIANLEGAARHQQAIDELRNTGAVSLYDTVSHAA